MGSITVPEIEVITSPWTGNLPDIQDASWPRLNAHRAAWTTAVSSGLGHSTYLIQATLGTESGPEVVGVLPLCLVAGPIFGKFLVSLPYVNTGGVWATDEQVARALVTSACELADQLQVKYLELRHEVPVSHPKLTFQRTDKIHMRLPLPESAETLLASLKSKVRSQVKKSTRSGLTCQFGGRELLSDFYQVFATNMRDLGTPVFSKNLFDSVLASFGSDAETCVVRSGDRAVAAALLVHAGHVTEVPSASCLRAFNHMNANMFMYWHLLQRSIEQGSHTFDFGRSSEGSGTHKFKAQWGADPFPAVWQYYVRHGDPADMRADSGSKKSMVKVWQRLPVWLTRIIGPTIVRGIP